MPFKINISDKNGKTYKLELETESFEGKQLHDVVPGSEVLPTLSGYEFEIMGASDSAGFTAHEDVEGIGLKKILLKYGKAFKSRPKHEGKRKRTKKRPKGLKLRKTVRGRVISQAIVQINLVVKKAGQKPLSEVFPEQNKVPETQPQGQTQAESSE